MRECTHTNQCKSFKVYYDFTNILICDLYRTSEGKLRVALGKNFFTILKSLKFANSTLSKSISKHLAKEQTLSNTEKLNINTLSGAIKHFSGTYISPSKVTQASISFSFIVPWKLLFEIYEVPNKDHPIPASDITIKYTTVCSLLFRSKKVIPSIRSFLRSTPT